MNRSRQLDVCKGSPWINIDYWIKITGPHLFARFYAGGGFRNWNQKAGQEISPMKLVKLPVKNSRGLFYGTMSIKDTGGHVRHGLRTAPTRNDAGLPRRGLRQLIISVFFSFFLSSQRLLMGSQDHVSHRGRERELWSSAVNVQTHPYTHTHTYTQTWKHMSFKHTLIHRHGMMYEALPPQAKMLLLSRRVCVNSASRSGCLADACMRQHATPS